MSDYMAGDIVAIDGVNCEVVEITGEREAVLTDPSDPTSDIIEGGEMIDVLHPTLGRMTVRLADAAPVAAVMPRETVAWERRPASRRANQRKR